MGKSFRKIIISLVLVLVMLFGLTSTAYAAKEKPFKITTQPKNVTVSKAGKQATVKCKASGNGITYTWYAKNKDDSEFTQLGTTKSTSYKIKVDHTGMQAYCIVTDEKNNTLQSNTVTLSLKKVTTAPKYMLAAYDYVLNGKEKTARSKGLQDDIIEKLGTKNAQLFNSFDTMFDSLGQDAEYLSNSTKKSLSNAIKGLFKKLKATTKIVSSEGDTVTVELSSKYIDFNAIVDKASVGAISDVIKAGAIFNKRKATEIIYKRFAKEFKSYKFPKDRRTQIFVLKENDASWSIVSPEDYFPAIMSTMIKSE